MLFVINIDGIKEKRNFWEHKTTSGLQLGELTKIANVVTISEKNHKKSIESDVGYIIDGEESLFFNLDLIIKDLGDHHYDKVFYFSSLTA